MVTVYTQGQNILWNPEVRQNYVLILLIKRREHENKSCNICCRRKIKPTVADAPLQFVLVYSECALVLFLHRHPAHRLLYPLVQTKLSESVLLAGVLLCGIASGFDLIYSDRNVKAWICFLPNLRVCPVIGFISAVNHGIKSKSDFPTLDYILGFLMSFVANDVGVRSGCGYKEIQRLHSCVTEAFGHYIKQLSVRLSVQLIYNNVDVEAVLAV